MKMSIKVFFAFVRISPPRDSWRADHYGVKPRIAFGEERIAGGLKRFALTGTENKKIRNT